LWASGLALTSAAWAQDRGGAVTIYGIVDGGVEYARTSAGATTPARSLKSVVTGSQSASRLGLRITEDLGDGLRASAVLEHGFDVDTGSVTGTAFWGRDAYVGLGGKWGELRLGRTYTPGFWVLVSGDVNRLGFYGNAGGFARLGPSGQTRAANGVNYISPSLGGFVLRATYAFGESASAPTDAGRFMAVAGEYTKGPLYAGVFHHVRRDVFPAESTTSASTRFSGVSARYDFGSFGLGAGLARFDPAGPDSATSGVTGSWWLGASVRVGVGDVRLTAGRLRTDLPTGEDPSGTMFGATYNHPLSRRTFLYATLGSMDNNDAGRFVLEASSRAVALPISAGADTRGIAAGIRHTF
jgi:predicted porin